MAYFKTQEHEPIRVQKLNALEFRVATAEAGGAGIGTANSIGDLESAPTTGPVLLNMPGRHGIFVFTTILADPTGLVTADTANAIAIAPTSDPTGASGVWLRQGFLDKVHLDWAGAVGDGTTFDTAAFQGINSLIEYYDGLGVELRNGADYTVGEQTPTPGAGYNFPPVMQFPIKFADCANFCSVIGNGARIRPKAGARYGAFNDDGSDVINSSGESDDPIGTPYYAMIGAWGCTGGILIANVELDGNDANLNLGGYYGDSGRQISASGVWLGHYAYDGGNQCAVSMVNVRAHHHGLDGLTRFSPNETRGDPTHRVTMLNCEFEYNARQGFSWVGGKGVTAINCKFNHTGKGAWASAPTAGLDIEVEGSSCCDDGEWINCEFINNGGPGAYGAFYLPWFQHFQGCTFIGTTSAATYDGGPFWSFDDCLIVGCVVNPYPSSIKPKAFKYTHCRFLGGTARSPTGTVYYPSGHMIDSGGSGAQGIAMEYCLLDGEDNTNARLSYLNGFHFHECELRQAAGAGAGVAQYSTWTGRNKITAAAGIDMYVSDHQGLCTVNGVLAGTSIPQTGTWGTHGSILAGYDFGVTAPVDGQFIGVMGSVGNRFLRLLSSGGVGYLDNRNPYDNTEGDQNYRALSHSFKIAGVEKLGIGASVAAFSIDVTVPDEAYGVGWNGSLEVPTKNAVYDKIETIGGGGVSDGDKTDITVSGSGAIWTIDSGVVSLAKMANMATASLIYRKTAGAGAPEVNTLATLKTDLGLTGTNSGDQTITLTGDVTGTGTGSFAATLARVNAAVQWTGTGYFIGHAGTGYRFNNAADTFNNFTISDAGAITVRAGGAFGGAISATNLSGTNTGDQTTISGNAGTATALQTARNINGVAFDGTANITINAVDSTARVPETRTISTTAPLTGGGDLSANRTLAISAATTGAAGSMSSADKTKLDAISGTNTGDQTITLTGNVTGSGTGSFATTIPAGTVTLAMQANMATASVVYRKTAGAGAPEVQTLATLKTDLGLTGTNSGDQTSIVGITGTLAQFNTAITDADIQPLDAQLTDLAGLSYTGNSLKAIRVNAGETGFELAAPVSAAPALTTAEVDLGSDPRCSGKFTITGSGMTTGKPVMIVQSVGPYTGKGTLADEAEMDQVSVSASVTSATVITGYYTSQYKVAGNFKFDYLIGA